MSLQNLPEDQLYSLLPQGVVGEDERGMMEALCGAVQDGVSDLRGYARRYETFWDTSFSGNWCVLVTFLTPQSRVVTRALGITAATPTPQAAPDAPTINPTLATPALVTWAAGQIGVDPSMITAAVRGPDLTRMPDPGLYQLLAASIGAVLYNQVGTIPFPSTPQAQAIQRRKQQQMLNFYFPRLKIKGTAQSFDALGRLMGWDDVRLIPLWGRASARQPQDMGAPANDPDYSQTPDFLPQQEIGPEYDPSQLRDGPFYTWSTFVSSDPTSESYFPQAINGLQPWISVQAYGDYHTVTAEAGTAARAWLAPLQVYPIVPGSISMVVGRDQVTDDGSGNLVVAEGLIVTGGTINYATGQIVLLGPTAAMPYSCSYTAQAARAATTGTTAPAWLISLDLAPVIAGTLALTVAGTVLTDDGNGNVGTGTINYTTGAVVLTGPTTQFTYTVNYSTFLSFPQGNSIVLAGGAPFTQASAWINADGSLGAMPTSGSVNGLLFQALGPGATFDGLTLTFTPATGGMTLTIADRLSSIKFRAPYFDMVFAMSPEKVIERFGTRVVQPGPDVQGMGGSAPFLPWAGGSFTPATSTTDYLTVAVTPPIVTPSGFSWVGSGTAPSQITLGGPGLRPQQFNTDTLTTAGTNSLAAMDEVRPASRFPRRIGVGFLDRDTVGYAGYTKQETLGILGNGIVSGTALYDPFPDYEVGVQVAGAWLAAETLPGSTVVDFSGVSGTTGSFDTATGIYAFNGGSGTTVAFYRATSTEVVRNVSGAGGAYQYRPEDQYDVVPPYQVETYDEFPWMQSLVGGGDVVEVAWHYDPTGKTEYDYASQAFVVRDQCGTENTVYGVESKSTGRIRLMSSSVDMTNGYQPAQRSIAYQGSFIPLEEMDTASPDDLGQFMQAGYGLYHVGLAQSVLVADPLRFYAPYHSQGLVGWIPFNEHPDGPSIAEDVSSTASVQSLNGLTEAIARQWDAQRGWYLYFAPVDGLTGSSPQGIYGELSLSFWIMPDPTATGSSNAIFAYGPISLSLDSSDNTFTISTVDNLGVASAAATLTLTPGVFTQIGITVTNTAIQYGIGSLTGPGGAGTAFTFSSATPTLSSGATALAWDIPLSIQAVSRGFGLSDLRLWNTVKTQAEMELVRYYQPVPTAVDYWPTTIQAASTGDRWGLSMLNSGLVYPAPMPAAIRYRRLALVERYNSSGLYTGEDRFNLVGMGGGPVVSYCNVGLQGQDINTDGQSIVVKSVDDDNPIYESGWVVTDGRAYEVSLQASALSSIPTLVATACQGISTGLAEDYFVSPSGYVSGSVTVPSLSVSPLLATANGYQMVCVSSPSGPQVTQAAFTGPSGSDPLYLYLNSSIVEDEANAYNVWSYDPTDYGFNLVPPMAALNANGSISFQMSQPLTGPGRYQLSLTSTNAGPLPVDDNFTGFNVLLQLGTAMSIQAVIGSDIMPQTPSGTFVTDIVGFDLPAGTSLPGPWILDVTWTNAASDSTMGTARALGILGLQVNSLATTVWEVGINPAGVGSAPTVTQVVSNLPGAYLSQINSLGAPVSTTHESQVYSTNDTFVSQFPASHQLTGATRRKVEDHYTLGTHTPEDIVLPTAPGVGSGVTAS